jgi:hypothetical protein
MKLKLMKTVKLYANLLMLLAAAMLVGCSDEPTPPVQNDEQAEVSAEVVSISDTTLEFSVTSTSATELRYIFAESSEGAPTKESILSEGTAVEANATVSLMFDKLAPKTKYTLHVAAQNALGSVYTYQEAETEESTKATLKLEVSDITESSANLTITSSNATEVKYLVVGEGVERPSNDEISANGEEVEPNTEVKVTLTDLEAGTRYNIYALALGNNSRAESLFSFSTLAPEPQLEASLGEDIGYDYATINVTAENVAELKYVCIKAGSRDVTADQVLKNGTDIESGEVKIEGLDEQTAYEVYVAAKGINEDVIMAEVITFTTTKNTIVYTLHESTIASAYKYSETNYYLTFIDEVNGYTLYADFYVEDGAEYLTSGEYQLGGFAAGEISMAYTSFKLHPTDITTVTFGSGSLNVVATPNEDTREVYYEITGELVFSDGNYVVLDFAGLVDGIALPEIVEGAPDGAHIFEVKESIQPTRYTGNVVPGEYYIKFTDNDGGEFRFDLLLDPAVCENGDALLPTGTYTTEQFNLSYTDFVTYRPSYKTWTFTDIKVDVTTEDTNHTIIVNATMVNGGETKPFYMNWSGEIKVQ